MPPLDAFEKVERRAAPNLPGLPKYADETYDDDKPQEAPVKKKSTQSQQKRRDRTQDHISPPQRRRSRKRGGVVIFLICIVLCIVFLGSMMLKIDNFEIEGECPYTLEEIVAVFGHEEGENLVFSFKAGDEEKNLLQALPYLETVQIHRRPLGTVIFRVTAAQEVYCTPWGEGFIILSAGRKVLRVAVSEPEGLIRLIGDFAENVTPGQILTAKEESAEEGLQTLLAELEAQAYEGVSCIDVSDAMKMSFVWQDRFTIVVGSKANLEAKLAYVLVLLTDTSQSRFTEADRGTIDVSGYPTSPNAIYSAA